MKLRLAAPLLIVALAVAACSVDRPPRDGSTSPDAGTPTTAASGEPASAVPTDEPAATVAPTEVPTAAPTAVPTAVPTAPASPAASAEPTASAAADVCTGSQDNRDFLAKAARDLDWTVLCAVLPKGWTVQAGSYNLASGGKMLMSYKSRSGATLALSEGAFCGKADGCVPAGSDVSDTGLGPMTGTLVALDDGGWAIVVDRGAKLSWLLVAHGVDQATATTLGAALAVVGD